MDIVYCCVEGKSRCCVLLCVESVGVEEEVGVVCCCVLLCVGGVGVEERVGVV